MFALTVRVFMSISVGYSRGSSRQVAEWYTARRGRYPENIVIIEFSRRESFNLCIITNSWYCCCYHQHRHHSQCKLRLCFVFLRGHHHHHHHH
jgi:hypothetical protein